MRAGVRASAALALTVCTVGLVPSVALADSAAPVVIATNWYWSMAAPNLGGNAVPVAGPSQASGVPDGDLGVGYVADPAGSSDKAAAVAFDMSTVPAGATFSSFVVNVPYDPAAQEATSGTPDVSACELIAGFTDAPGPSDMAQVPPISLPSCVKGTFSATIGKVGGYAFDLTAIANDWSGGAPPNGILIRPTAGLPDVAPNAPATQQPFSLSFLGKNGITTQATYTPAPVTQAAPPPVVPAGPALAPPPPPPPVSVAAPVLPAYAPSAPAVAPAPAPQVNPPPAPAPQAAAYVPGALVPSTTWWLGLLVLLALLGLTSVVLGDPLAPVPADPRRRRFADAVHSRALGGTPATPAGHRSAPRFRPA